MPKHAEASRRTGKDRINRFRIASGEAEEARAALNVAVVRRLLPATEVERALKHADRVGKRLYGVIR